jgi:hypothetical protein
VSADLQTLIPVLREPAKALVDLAGRAGVQPRVTSTLRSHAQQKRLYDAFLRGETQYPVAPPGLSAHEFGYAFDMIAATQSDLHDLGTVWRSWGGVWSAEDEVHFEYPGFNPSTAQSVLTCSPLYKGIAQAVDLALGFAPGIGEVELAAWLVSFGFPHSEVLAFLQNPVSYTACR